MDAYLSENDDAIGLVDGPISDSALMVRVQRDEDTDAFRELASRHRGPLCRFFAALLPTPSQADDFAQETLLRLWLARHRYTPTGSFSSYLFQIARHYWLNQKDRAYVYAAQAPLPADDQLEFLAPVGAQPETVLLARWEQERLQNAVTALPEIYQTVFTLSHQEGLKQSEIAYRLGIPVGTVKSRLSEAVRRLRQTLISPQEREEELPHA